MSKWSMIFAVLMSFLIISMSQAQEVREAVYNSNIRSCAGTSQQGCSIVATLNRGTAMTVLGSAQSAYGGGTTWYNVQAGNLTGWILGRLTRVSQAQPAAPAQPAPAQPAAPAQQQSDNKCYEGWVCTTDADWERGYWAKQAELQGGAPQGQPAAEPHFVGWTVCTSTSGLLGDEIGWCAEYSDGSLKWAGYLRPRF